MKKIYNSASLRVVEVKNNIIATSGPQWSDTQKSADNALVGGRRDGDFEDF